LLDFENLTGNVTLASQYADSGVTFANSPELHNYTSLPGFCHSGHNAVLDCPGAPTCTQPILMAFTPAVARVKLRVGYGAISSGWSNPNQPVVLRLFSGPSGTGDTMAVATKTLVANAGSFVPMVPLEAWAQTATVKSAKVSFLNAEGVSPTIFNKDL